MVSTTEVDYSKPVRYGQFSISARLVSSRTLAPISVAKELKIPPNAAVASRSASERMQFDPTTTQKVS